MRLVRAMKAYGHVRVKNAIAELDWPWNLRHRRISTNVERIVEGMPRIELERILSILRRDWSSPMPTETFTSKHFVSRGGI